MPAAARCPRATRRRSPMPWWSCSAIRSCAWRWARATVRPSRSASPGRAWATAWRRSTAKLCEESVTAGVLSTPAIVIRQHLADDEPQDDAVAAVELVAGGQRHQQVHQQREPDQAQVLSGSARPGAVPGRDQDVPERGHHEQEADRPDLVHEREVAVVGRPQQRLALELRWLPGAAEPVADRRRQGHRERLAERGLPLRGRGVLAEALDGLKALDYLVRRGTDRRQRDGR